MPAQIVDLFCGIGGLTHGLINSGLNVIAGFDIDPTCQYTYEHNNHI
ncbi:DNA cytosine methyltransferase, partial [Ruminococcus bicirculans (ex Wegman et al. 2014)]